MYETSRRRFLAATGAGAVAVGAASIVPGGLAHATEGRGDLDFDGVSSDTSIIVSIDDPATGRLTVMRGERELTVTDHELAARVAHLAGSEL
jgi:hypothetical protein